MCSLRSYECWCWSLPGFLKQAATGVWNGWPEQSLCVGWLYQFYCQTRKGMLCCYGDMKKACWCALYRTGHGQPVYMRCILTLELLKLVACSYWDTCSLASYMLLKVDRLAMPRTQVEYVWVSVSECVQRAQASRHKAIKVAQIPFLGYTGSASRRTLSGSPAS